MLATLTLVALMTIAQPPPPTPAPVTHTLSLTGALHYFMTPLTITTPISAPTEIPTFDFMELVRRGGPVSAYVLQLGMSPRFMAMFFGWRIGLIAVVFVFDFVMGKLGRRMGEVTAADPRLQRLTKTIRSVRETAARGRAIRRSR